MAIPLPMRVLCAAVLMVAVRAGALQTRPDYSGTWTFVPPPTSHALGASPADILDYVLRGVVAQSALGIGLGLGVYWSVSRWLAGRLFGLSALDPLTLVAAVGALLAVAIAAAVVPALHATRIDPSEALRAGLTG